MWHVCSDIHIGIAGSREDYLYKVLTPKLKAGDTLVLLGDIFDYWISSYDYGLEQLKRGWATLILRLRELREAGIETIFVPGNHDSFVFYNEWWIYGGCPPWLEALYGGGAPPRNRCQAHFGWYVV